MYREVNGKWGYCKFFAKDMYVGRSMNYYGEYGPDETEKVLSLASGLCLDIGANIGCITQALLANNFTVLAIEPQPEVYRCLRSNICRYTTGNAMNVAVGSAVGTAKMPVVHYSDKNNIGGLGIGQRSIYGTYEVPVVTIDSLEVTPGFMKIDVEGYELEVLQGASATIKYCRPIMYIEDDRAEKSRALRQYIEELGYTIEEHRPTLYRENNFFGLKKNVWDRNYASHNLICLPKVH